MTNNAQAALREKDTRAVKVELTPEVKEKFAGIIHELIDLLKAKTDGPVEAYMVLQLAMHTLEDVAGIRGGIVMENDDVEH